MSTAAYFARFRPAIPVLVARDAHAYCKPLPSGAYSPERKPQSKPQIGVRVGRYGGGVLVRSGAEICDVGNFHVGICGHEDAAIGFQRSEVGGASEKRFVAAGCKMSHEALARDPGMLDR
jgi:hypothetical protein